MTEKRFKDNGFDNIKHYTETSMTEKRFSESIYGITDTQTNVHYGWREADLGIMKLCELLNNLNQEISDLKKWLSTVPQLENRISKLNDENEQLKKEGADVERLIDDLGSEELRRQYEEIINGDVE